MIKIANFLKNNLKYFLVATAVVIIIIAGFFCYQRINSENSDREFISFGYNYSFDIPENHYIDADTALGSTIIMPNEVESFNPTHYQNILEEGGIVIQSFPSLNKNDGLFEKYIRDRYKSNENTDVDISFEQINENKVATVNMYNKSTKITEFIKIVNLASPVIIASSKPSEALNLIVESIKNIDVNEGDFGEIKRQITTTGTLLKARMYSDFYSMFSQDYKEKISENDFEIIIKDSENMIQRQIHFNGGILNYKDNEFSCKLVLVDPENVGDYRSGYIDLKKEKGQWLISKLNIPKDDKKESDQQ